MDFMAASDFERFVKFSLTIVDFGFKTHTFPFQFSQVFFPVMGCSALRDLRDSGNGMAVGPLSQS